MKTVQVTYYTCELCGARYSNESEARKCESRPVTHDGVKVGDRVRILTGEGVGDTGIITAVFVYDKNWGHYAWERYWHTVGITAKIDGHTGSRQLTFDAYKKL